MEKVAVVVLADTETAGDLGRVVNAMQTVKEFKEAGDEVLLLFDGAGVKWAAELPNKDHKYHSLFEQISDKIAGVCKYCAGAFEVNEKVEEAGLPFASDFEDHPSFRTLISKGYQILTF